MSKSPTYRIDKNFIDRGKLLMNERILKGLQKPRPHKETGIPEFTRLIMKTKAWREVEEELRTKPKKYD